MIPERSPYTLPRIVGSEGFPAATWLLLVAGATDARSQGEILEVSPNYWRLGAHGI